MGSGLVIDDGGSTRIKWMGRAVNEKGEIDPIVGRMNRLMNVSGSDRQRSTHEISNDPYTTIRIVWQDPYGIAHQEDSIDFPIYKSIVVSSHLEQNVEVQNTGSGLIVMLSGNLIEPIVEARQHDQKRRYIVLNSGHIEKVVLDGVPKFDKSDKSLPPYGNETIYTSVVLK